MRKHRENNHLQPGRGLTRTQPCCTPISDSQPPEQNDFLGFTSRPDPGDLLWPQLTQHLQIKSCDHVGPGFPSSWVNGQECSGGILQKLHVSFLKKLSDSFPDLDGSLYTPPAVCDHPASPRVPSLLRCQTIQAHPSSRFWHLPIDSFHSVESFLVLDMVSDFPLKPGPFGWSVLRPRISLNPVLGI